MHCDVSVFLGRIEAITAIITTLDEETAALVRGMPLLRRYIPEERHAGHLYLDAVDATLAGMRRSHARLHEAVAGLPSSSDIQLPATVVSTPEAVRDAATTLVIIRNALDMLANDREGMKNLALWQRELFTKAHSHIARVVETLHEARKSAAM